MDTESQFLEEWFPDDDEKNFVLKVRIRSIWDEEQFLRMERIAQQMLDVLEKDASRREQWRYAFTERMVMIKNLLSHPGFLTENDLAMTKEQYQEYIGHRIERVEALKKRYEALTVR